MNILIFTLGSRGDVQPYIALGKALRRSGHDVTLSSGAGFEDLIAAHGLASVPTPIDVRELLETPEMRDALQSLPGMLRAWRLFKGQFRKQYDAMWDIARAVRFLCGPESSWITGVNLPVDGGHHLRRGPNYDTFATAMFGDDIAQGRYESLE